MNRVKNVYQYMFLLVTNEMISELLNRLYVILRKTPISFQDDVEYKIRQYVSLQKL